jgi:hypothetical protein
VNQEGILRFSLSSSLDFSQVPREAPQFTLFDRSDYVTTKVRTENQADQKPFEGAEVFLNGQGTGQRTGPSGVALIRNLPRRQTTRVSIRTDDLENPYLRPDPSAWRVRGALGKRSDLTIELRAAGEITGFIRSASPKVRLGGIRISIYSSEGQEVAVVRSTQDGYFYFGDVAPGSYRLRASTEDLESRGLKVEGPSNIELNLDAAGEMSIETLIQVR